MVFHWTNLPGQPQGSGVVSCLGAAAAEQPYAASGAAAEPHTSAAGTEPPSWGADARPAELPEQHVGLTRCRQRSVAAAFGRRMW